MPDSSFCQRDIDKIERTKYGMVSHRIAVSLAVITTSDFGISYMYCDRHTGTSAKLLVADSVALTLSVGGF